MRIWTQRAKPEEPKFSYLLTTRCITDKLNYVLMMQDYRDCATHHVAEEDCHVYTSRQGSEWTTTKKINCC